MNISTLCISNSCSIIVRLWWKQFANQVKFGFCSEKQIITEQREQRNQREPTHSFRVGSIKCF